MVDDNLKKYGIGFKREVNELFLAQWLTHIRYEVACIHYLSILLLA